MTKNRKTKSGYNCSEPEYYSGTGCVKPAGEKEKPAGLLFSVCGI